jgi:hypothetical protein
VNLLYPVVREPKPAEPLHDGPFRILAEPSNCIKSPAKRQDSPRKWQPVSLWTPTTRKSGAQLGQRKRVLQDSALAKPNGSFGRKQGFHPKRHCMRNA